MRFLWGIYDLLRHTGATLKQNKLRSSLTVLSIAWGVASLVLLTSFCEGFREGKRRKSAVMGQNVVYVWGSRTEMQAGGRKAGRLIQLYQTDVQAIREQCPAVARVAGELTAKAVTVASESNSKQFTVLGIDPDYQNIRSLPLENGRRISWADVQRAGRVCVLGWSARAWLFEEGEEVLSREVKINGYPYLIVGVRSEKDQSGTLDGADNDKIIVPTSSLRRDCPPNRDAYQAGGLSAIVYQPLSLETWDAAQRQVRRMLGRIHDFDPGDRGALLFLDTAQDTQLFVGVIDSMETFLGVVALVTLSLGGLSVMNMMMISVAERTHEIGLKKAVGATRRRIMLEFFSEGLCLALIGGPAGLAIAGAVAPWVNSLPLHQLLFSGLSVDLRGGLLIAASLGGVAIASALPPAWRAARLTPVEALREER